MITILNKIPRDVVVACSGGVDSMAIVDFLKNNHNITLQFVHHGTETSEEAYHFLKEYSSENNLSFVSCRIDNEIPDGMSAEQYWHNERYKIFHSWDMPVITCHHLDDSVETWVWRCMHGDQFLIPYQNKNVIRPFLLNRKSEFINWCIKHDVPWVEDKSNKDNKYTRNFIRNEMMDKVLVVNPGIHKVIRKKIINQYKQQ